MKKLISLLITCLFGCFLIAQSPQSLNYQAIAWNSDNTPRANQLIRVKIAILNQSAAGPEIFNEEYPVTTNSQGLFTLEIGSLNLNDFQKINWGSGAKFLQVSIDGVLIGTSKMLSVPYALYAENTNLKAGAGIGVSGNTITNTGDLDNTNEIQTLSISGDSRQLSLSKGGGTVLLPSSGGTTGPTYSGGSGISISPTNVISTDLRAGEGIAINGNTISATNTGGGGTGTTYTAGKGISINGNTISNAGDGDTSTVNEIQTLSLNSNNNELTLSKGGGTVTLPTGSGGGGTTYTAGAGINITGNTISANEQQSLNYADGVLSISNGNEVTLPTKDHIESRATNQIFTMRNEAIWQPISNVANITVPTSGLYLVYFSGWINTNNNDEAAIRVVTTTGSKSTNIAHCVTLFSGGRGSGSSTWPLFLEKGEVLRMELNLYHRSTLPTEALNLYVPTFGIVRIR
ncbi:hypothetical protein [Haliscomenobacter hydrossis]|uniref:C1q domain-containing protein n=1 Tax=Haliscomenobacter hydrossis (strain ATCC 27775 / DSM 1100 / LMG 10767 / O) TaxID=760192 RepID=F4KS42_HALH1|nr:hypothetical protein [Haliscomenobacter hydrossis]AEE52287.1 hypothetical protein Halhy_4446 [Haliscomenobacter hydrossis DSM 1100]